MTHLNHIVDDRIMDYCDKERRHPSKIEKAIHRYECKVVIDVQRVSLFSKTEEEKREVHCFSFDMRDYCSYSYINRNLQIY